MHFVHIFERTACELKLEQLVGERRLVWPTNQIVEEILSVRELGRVRNPCVIRGRFGKPYLLWPRCRWQFSISHGINNWWCAFAESRTIGLDVEEIVHGLSPMYESNELTVDERKELRTLDDFEFPTVFLQYWTLKEAYTKALGYGLLAPFSEINVRISSGGHVVIRDQDPAREILLANLELLSIDLGKEILSLAIHRKSRGEPINIVFHGRRSAELAQNSAVIGFSSTGRVQFYNSIQFS
ncbi:4'-phosphopantetheinyl transferase superfamily protein [Methylicorpusculum sp.]|uniref:4'-phosphopantetheinyl transferase family protein n=1 Tax=Methylicorpusculum sp. TaxID=2713644 RepID=UPI002732C568|nr:4'-phosphopantetheinyl transferase superfamily protein [Methylicorpusculum sp.]MDP3530249.1 4'-phosphopantetheinyl transferase superfamily protein [Methylicorpusculum sp.]MDZ4153093.1 4'-phosphopantetheinyl transferase superfamily protein [Methylicorpusculum sp.]